MAIFSNQATLTYNGVSTNSNIAYGEILDVITAAKTAIEQSYRPGEVVSYVLTVTNTASTQLNGITVTDDLGGYALGDETVYPLTYEDGTATLFINGILQPSPAVTAGPGFVVSGLNIPAGGNAVLVYQARVNSFAQPSEGGSIVNTATVTGGGISEPVTAAETIFVSVAPALSISKSITPAQVVDNDRVSYTFVISNSGNRALVATDDTTVTDVFDPVLSGLTVTFNSEIWTDGVEYNYDPITGVFTTAPGRIVVDAASYVRDPQTGEFNTTPGVATLTVTGTI